MLKILWFTIGFALCCAAGFYLASGALPLWIAFVFLIPAILLLLLKDKRCRVAGVVCLGFAVGAIWIWGYNFFYLQPVRVYDGQMVSARFEISDYSYETQYGSSANGKVDINGSEYDVRIYFNESQHLKPGDVVTGQFKLGLTIPKGVEESTYYQSEGIFLLAEQESDIQVELAEEIPGRYFPQKLRQDIIGTLKEMFPEDVIGFVCALLLGDDTMLTYEEDTAFRVSGIRHVIAVSGLHVSILFSLVYTMVGKHRYLTAIVCIPVLILFASVAGFSPSIIRACIMQSLMMLALFLNREYDPPTALSFAVLVMLLLNPMTILSVNLQLSVSCMIGILFFSKRLSRFILLKLGWPTGKSLKAKLARWFSGSVAVTLSAMTVTTPLVGAYFGMVSVIGVITNLIALWVISFIFYGILLTCLTGAIWAPLGKVIAWIVAWPVRYVLQVAKLCASIPFAAVYTTSIYILVWIAVCYFVFVLLLLSKKKRPFLAVGCLVICLCIAIGATCLESRTDDLRVTVFDVGEGQSVLIQDDGRNFLVDCGGSSAENTADLVAETLLNQGIFSLDGVILTHYDNDHTAALPLLLTRVGVDRLYLPRIADPSGVRDAITSAYQDRIMWIYGNTEISYDESKLTLIASVTDAPNPNESSLCILFQKENCDILITGDRGHSGEMELLESFPLPELELLVAGHHGAATSTNFELLSVTQPDVVAISTSGRYNHPSKELLNRLSLFDCTVWRTDESGTLVFRR